MLNEINSDWTEKYRPTSLKDIVLNSDAKKLIEKYISDGIIDNILLCSRPGQGKTSLAKLLANHIFKCDTLYVNASDENNVDVVRSKISGFSRTRSSDGNFKIVILDEADGFANVQSQRILRALMEEVSDNTRFIITANHKSRILEAIRSRCKFIDITPTLIEIVKRVIYILHNENVKFDYKKDGELLESLIRKFYPDIRSIIKNLQASVYNGELLLKDYRTDNEFIKSIYDFIAIDGDYMNLREFIIKNENKFNCDYQGLINDFYQYIIDSDETLISWDVRPKIVVILAEYLYRFDSSIDPEINAIACFYKIIDELKKEPD